jgi:hypothetical protein
MIKIKIIYQFCFDFFTVIFFFWRQANPEPRDFFLVYNSSARLFVSTFSSIMDI